MFYFVVLLPNEGLCRRTQMLTCWWVGRGGGPSSTHRGHVGHSGRVMGGAEVGRSELVLKYDRLGILNVKSKRTNGVLEAHSETTGVASDN